MIQLYRNTFIKSPASITKLSGTGSNRIYYRYADESGKTVIAVKGESQRENKAFLALASQMREKDIPVPQILAVSDDGMSSLQEDLGSVSLFDLIDSAKRNGTPWNENVVAVLKQVMSDLPKIQFETARGFDFNLCVREKRFDATSIRWDLNYFKYCFLKLTRIHFDEIELENEFVMIEKSLLDIYEKDHQTTFLYRDFQSRNVMVKDAKPYYIDFQGGFEGPIYYDLASFLWQARAAYPSDLREELLLHYHAALKPYYDIDFNSFNDHLQEFVFFRLLQVLGAYGYRGLFEHKVAFITPIPQALLQLLDFRKYPYIHSLITQISQLPQFSKPSSDGKLIVRVTSFSYKKGIPEDFSGNGGGFVFDCRAPHNPGRYEEYKKLTGLDRKVIDFLESNSEMPNFIRNVYSLVDPAVETYLNRGFTSLMVNFGCTGGQHRSVYGAQHLAEHLAHKFPNVKVILTHRELGITNEFN